MPDDLRVCFVGDSFVAGVGDPEHLGWVGRLAARTHRQHRPLTAYVLGVRRETSRDVAARWRAECEARLPPECDGRVVVSVGVNDTTLEDGAVRVTARLPIEDLGEIFGVELPADEVETVGGLLAQSLGRVPIPGATVDLGGLHLVAEGVTGRRNRIDSVLVRRVQADDPSDTAPTTQDEERQPADA